MNISKDTVDIDKPKLIDALKKTFTGEDSWNNVHEKIVDQCIEKIQKKDVDKQRPHIKKFEHCSPIFMPLGHCLSMGYIKSCSSTQLWKSGLSLLLCRTWNMFYFLIPNFLQMNNVMNLKSS